MQGHRIWNYWKRDSKKLGCQSQTKTLTVPTLSIGSKYDTMDPEHMKWIANEVQNGRFLFCPNGSHLSRMKNLFSRSNQVFKRCGRWKF
jgi:proline iminopeptidase